jgi:hypothetical protein
MPPMPARRALTPGRATGTAIPMPGRRHKDFHFVDVHVGARLRRWREQMDMSRERLDAAVGT